MEPARVSFFRGNRGSEGYWVFSSGRPEPAGATRGHDARQRPASGFDGQRRVGGSEVRLGPAAAPGSSPAPRTLSLVPHQALRTAPPRPKSPLLRASSSLYPAMAAAGPSHGEAGNPGWGRSGALQRPPCFEGIYFHTAFPLPRCKQRIILTHTYICIVYVSVCMRVYIYIFIHMCMCAYMCMYVRISMCIHTYIHMYVCAFIRLTI